MSVVTRVGAAALAAVSSEPAPKRARREPKTLDEDEFVASVDAIVERDFFPDLPKLRAQQEYLDAVQRNDFQKMKELRLKSVLRTPGAVPREAPSEAPPAAPEAPRAPNVSLDTFLAAHQGEDTAAFAKLRAKDEKRAAQRKPWLALTSAENESRRQQALLPGQTAHLLTWKYDPKNPLFYTPSAEMTAEEEAQRSRGAQKGLDYTNTRITSKPHAAQAKGASAGATWTVVKTGEEDLLERKRRERYGVGPVDLDDLAKTPGRPGEADAVLDTRRFVATPSPAPGDSPFTTWGRVEGTPLMLEQALETPIDMAPGPQFRVPEPPKREQLAMKLADKAAKSQRAKTPQRTGGSTPLSAKSKASPSPLHRMMSPSGRSDMQLRASYSSPAHMKKEPTTPKASSGSAARPPVRSEPPTPQQSSVTDDLLKL